LSLKNSIASLIFVSIFTSYFSKEREFSYTNKHVY